MSATLVCRGSRGSAPVDGPGFARYGGATTCFELDLGNAELVVLIDAGSGALSLVRERERPPRDTLVLFTHLHLDHIIGLPFLPWLYDPAAHLDLVGRPHDGVDVAGGLSAAFRPPLFPVAFTETSSTKAYHEPTGTLAFHGLSIRGADLFHPGGVTGYRIEGPGFVLAVLTDVEHGDEESDRSAREIARGADVLIHDAQYLPTETGKKGWGHSTWEEAVSVAGDAGVDRLLLTSHDPNRTDDEVDAILASARRRFPRTDAASGRMALG